MTVEQRQGRIYINSVFVGKNAADLIFSEILTKDKWEKILAELQTHGRTTINFSHNKITSDYEAKLKDEKKKNRLLESKLAAVKKSFWKRRI